jgi:hypothetical protein
MDLCAHLSETLGGHFPTLTAVLITIKGDNDAVSPRRNEICGIRGPFRSECAGPSRSRHGVEPMREGAERVEFTLADEYRALTTTPITGRHKIIQGGRTGIPGNLSPIVTELPALGRWIESETLYRRNRGWLSTTAMGNGDHDPPCRPVVVRTVCKPDPGGLQYVITDSAGLGQIQAGSPCRIGAAHQLFVPSADSAKGYDWLRRRIRWRVLLARLLTGRHIRAPVCILTFQSGWVETELIGDPFKGFGEAKPLCVLDDVEHVALIARRAEVLDEALLQIDGEVAFFAFSKFFRAEDAGEFRPLLSVDLKPTSLEEAPMVMCVETIT